jgi:hypothetical protein
VIFIDFQHEGRAVALCLFEPGPVPVAYSSDRSEIAFKPQLPRADCRFSSLVALKWAKEGVCTMCTPWASDRAVLLPGWAGLRMFSGEWRKFKAWNPVRVPPRAQCFRSSVALWEC